MNIKPTVFVASSVENLDTAKALQRLLSDDANVVLWSDLPSMGTAPLEAMLGTLDRVDSAIAVLGERLEHGSRARDNVMFELGLLLGKLGRTRTFVVAANTSTLAIPSDISGVPFIRYDPHHAAHDLLAALAPAAAMIRRSLSDLPLDRTEQAFYSCFLSYSVHDREFVDRLHAGLRDVGVRCWLDSHELTVGTPLVQQFEEAIRGHDRILLVLSRWSVVSGWVKYEVERAFEKEQRSRQSILFPLRLDDAVFETHDDVFSQLRTQRQIADFTTWRDQAAYQRAFARLVRALTVTVAAESKAVVS